MTHFLSIAALVGLTSATFSCSKANLKISDASLEGAKVGEFRPRSEVLDAIDCNRLPTSVSVAFFDADSTLRVSKSGNVSANGPTDVFVLPFAAEKIKELNRKNVLVAVVSNQLGVSSGYVTEATAAGALKYMAARFKTLGARIDYIAMATKADDLRKPDIGMATELNQKLESKCKKRISLESSFMVGDSAYKQGADGPSPDGRPADDFSNSDRLFARKLGVDFYEPTDYFDWRKYGVFNIAKPEELRSFVDEISRDNPAEAAAMRRVNNL